MHYPPPTHPPPILREGVRTARGQAATMTTLSAPAFLGERKERREGCGVAGGSGGGQGGAGGLSWGGGQHSPSRGFLEEQVNIRRSACAAAPSLPLGGSGGAGEGPGRCGGERLRVWGYGVAWRSSGQGMAGEGGSGRQRGKEICDVGISSEDGGAKYKKGNEIRG